MNNVRSGSLVSVAAALLLITVSNAARSESTTSSGAAVATLGAGAPAKEYLELDRANFSRSTTINNEWWPLNPGTRLTYEGFRVEDGKKRGHRVVFTVTDLTKEIGGVHTVVCWDQDFIDGKLVEAEIVFFAQNNDGAVWSLGEYPEEYEDGKFVAAPTWIHGIKDGKAGILVPGKPKLGTPSFSQGWAPSVSFTDRGVVYQMGQKTTVPLGTYDDVLVIDESNKEEPDAHALKYYARGVGNVRVGTRGVGDQESLDLTKVEQLSAEDLAKARDGALKLEKRAYEISKDVYAHTKPSERPDSKLVESGTLKNGPERTAATRPPHAELQAPAQVRKISDEKAKEIALRTVPGEVMGVTVERKFGKQTIVVEVIADADGSETDVVIDMETGKVLATEK